MRCELFVGDVYINSNTTRMCMRNSEIKLHEAIYSDIMGVLNGMASQWALSARCSK